MKRRRIVFPRQLRPQPSLGDPPTTVAAPISGETIATANNRPDDENNWQNEPGPGYGQRPENEIARRHIEDMEKVPRVDVPPA